MEKTKIQIFFSVCMRPLVVITVNMTFSCLPPSPFSVISEKSEDVREIWLSL
jgi:hypothetical protein